MPDGPEFAEEVEEFLRRDVVASQVSFDVEGTEGRSMEHEARRDDEPKVLHEKCATDVLLAVLFA